VSVGGHDPKMGFKSSHHLLSCQYPSWTLKSVCLGSRPQDGLQLSHHLWSCQYPSWTLKGVSWGSRPQDSLQVFSPFVAVSVPKLDPERWATTRGVQDWLTGVLINRKSINRFFSSRKIQTVIEPIVSVNRFSVNRKLRFVQNPNHNLTEKVG